MRRSNRGIRRGGRNWHFTVRKEDGARDWISEELWVGKAYKYDMGAMGPTGTWAWGWHCELRGIGFASRDLAMAAAIRGAYLQLV